jgi:hypothetical protein
MPTTSTLAAKAFLLLKKKEPRKLRNVKRNAPHFVHAEHSLFYILFVQNFFDTFFSKKVCLPGEGISKATAERSRSRNFLC